RTLAVAARIAVAAAAPRTAVVAAGQTAVEGADNPEAARLPARAAGSTAEREHSAFVEVPRLAAALLRSAIDAEAQRPPACEASASRSRPHSPRASPPLRWPTAGSAAAAARRAPRTT